MVEDDIIAREDMRKLTENRLSFFNINFANTQHTKPIIPSSTATDADGVNVATNTLLKKDKNVETESVQEASP